MKKTFLLLTILGLTAVGCNRNTAEAPILEGDLPFQEGVQVNQDVSLKQSLVQYTQGLLNVTYSAHAKRSDFNQRLKDLDDATITVAANAAGPYGAVAQNEFLQIWRSLTVGMVDYTVGIRNADQVKISQANYLLSLFVKDTEDFFVKYDTKVPGLQVSRALNIHILNLKNTVGAYNTSDMGKVEALEKEAALYSLDLVELFEN